MLRSFWICRRYCSSSGLVERRPSILKRKLDSTVAYYEECIGITELQKARNEVTQCEQRLYEAQVARREQQAELKRLQSRLKEIHGELDRTARGEDKYLHLITEEHAAIKMEQALMAKFEELENNEREAFSLLSNRVRASHEREREREERTKYWSLSASLVGALLGILGTSIGNELRMRRFKEMLPTSQQVRPVLEELTNLVNKEQEQVAKFLADVRDALKFESAKVAIEKPARNNESMDQILRVLKSQNKELSTQMDELKRLIFVDKKLNPPTTNNGQGEIPPNQPYLVLSEAEIHDLVSDAQKNLESKMKLQTVLSVVLVYSTLVLAVPILYILFRKDF